MGPEEFDRNVELALADAQLRRNFAFAMGSFIARRQAVFSDAAQTERLRGQGQALKRRVLSRLPELLEELEANCTRNGIQVHWAETPAVANRLVLDIIERHAATRVVKGKSMVSEEMHLNAFLEKHGVEVVETDLGEFIIQLNGETPSHIIVPAIHKNKQQIARIFHEKVPGAPYTEEVEELNAIARATLRRKFAEAGVGISGVNFAVAETGTLCLVENEGNGRMCTTLPPVHIAVMGLEKVVEKLADLPPLLRLLTGSATGQFITTYVNLISSPRRAGEKDGPTEVHLVILDNGRSRIYADPELRQTLQCVRCGTCLNHCPVYTRIGGHAYGFVPGADRQDPQPPGFRTGPGRRPHHGLEPLRRLRGGLPRQDPHHRAAAAPAQRGGVTGGRERRARPRQPPQPNGAAGLGRVAVSQHPPAGQPPAELAAGPHRQRAAPGGAPGALDPLPKGAPFRPHPAAPPGEGDRNQR